MDAGETITGMAYALYYQKNAVEDMAFPSHEAADHELFRGGSYCGTCWNLLFGLCENEEEV